MSDATATPCASNGFHVLVKPIGPICNLRCAYCFYLEKEQLYGPGESWRMTDETLERFTRQYIAGQPPGASEVNFAWQGGEPTLMGVDFFRRAVALQKRAAEELGRPGLRISNALQTNATLLDDQWGRFLHEENFLVGVSIDGPQPLHDRYRLDVQGRGTFDAVMAGLEVLKRHQVEYNALTVVQADNAAHPVEVYDFLVDAGFQFHQYIPIVERDGETGVSGRSVSPAELGRFFRGIFDRWLQREHVGEVYVQLFDMMLGVAVGYPPSLCVHGPTCGRAVALEHNGDLYSCDHWVFPENRLGSIADTTLAAMVDGGFQTAFGRDKFDRLTAECRACPYLRYCHGLCPKDRIATSPAGESGHPYLCAGYRAFYSHSLPVFEKMARCLRLRRPARDYKVIDQLRPPAAPVPRGGVGRNDPCPCGSGRKYKKCCGQ
ncbi:MAG: anaerobic sulfatase maturase [Planctomycetes bacterium]|nr:anaerobic sulfatase maturase [Planctomycetota bacterium]